MINEIHVKPNAERPFHRLPFIGSDHPLSNGNKFSFWDVPPKGGYGGGNDIGYAMAAFYLNYLREYPENDGMGGLQRIVFSMIERYLDLEQNDSEDIDGVYCLDKSSSLRGQIVGFFVYLEKWLYMVTKYQPGGLGNLDQPGVVNKVNKLLNRNYADYDLERYSKKPGAKAKRVRKMAREKGLEASKVRGEDAWLFSRGGSKSRLTDTPLSHRDAVQFLHEYN